MELKWYGQIDAPPTFDLQLGAFLGLLDAPGLGLRGSLLVMEGLLCRQAKPTGNLRPCRKVHFMNSAPTGAGRL